MTIIGLGVDLCKIVRFEQIIAKRGKRFLTRIFHENEIKNRPPSLQREAQYFAARWAVKEAVWKALRYRVEARNIQIINEVETKAPILVLEGDALERAKMLGKCDQINPHVSISHEGDYVVAFVILEDSK
jgi:holo-[acyl-carrier protein] synthase